MEKNLRMNLQKLKSLNKIKLKNDNELKDLFHNLKKLCFWQ